MTLEQMAELFKKYSDEFLYFRDVSPKLNRRADLHAFLLLDSLVTSDRDMISAAEHDEIYLDVSPSEIAAFVTESQIIELVRCGVMYDEDSESFSMFA